MADKGKRKATPKEIFTPSKKDDKQNKDPQCSICTLLLEKMDQLIASVNATEKKLKQKDINEQKLISKINDLEEQLGILKENSAKSTEAVISNNIDDWKNMIEEKIDQNRQRNS